MGALVGRCLAPLEPQEARVGQSLSRATTFSITHVRFEQYIQVYRGSQSGKNEYKTLDYLDEGDEPEIADVYFLF